MNPTRAGLLLITLLSLSPAFADRGAFTVEAGGGASGLLVPAPWSQPSVVTPSLSGLVLANVRYAWSHRLELTLGGFFEPTVTEFHHGAVLTTDAGVFPGVLRHQLTRFGAHAGARLVFGMVWRWVLGLELGWSRRSYSGFQHIDVGPDGPLDFGLALPGFDVDSVVLAPVFGLEWAVGDHWSLSLLPRLQVLVGPEPTVALLIPISLSWSWYL